MTYHVLLFYLSFIYLNELVQCQFMVYRVGEDYFNTKAVTKIVSLTLKSSLNL